MSGSDARAFLTPVSATSPCGEDLGDDPAFGVVERSLAGTPERQMGDTIIPAQEPDWRHLHKQCGELLSRTRHLRLIVWYTLTLLKQQGAPGVRDGLALLRGVLENYWEQVYPRLDPEDDNDLLEPRQYPRPLCTTGFGDPILFDKRLRMPLAHSRQLSASAARHPGGHGRDQARPVSALRADLATLEAAFKDTSTDDLSATAGAGRRSSTRRRFGRP
ncbi:MAG: type VI secretion system ImpA family N-terminal domain-containing protein [Singulisphaera sp.]